MHRSVIRPRQPHHPRPRLTVNLGLEGLQLVARGAADRGQVGALLNAVEEGGLVAHEAAAGGRAGGGAEAEVVSLVQAGAQGGELLGGHACGGGRWKRGVVTVSLFDLNYFTF